MNLESPALKARIIPPYFRFLIRVYLAGICFFTFFRLLLFASNMDQVNSIPGDEKTVIVCQSFFMGLRFDTVISAYILVLPFLLFSFFYLFNLKYRIWVRSISIFILLSFCIAFLVCSADIPYYNHFSSRFTTTAFAWKDSPAFMVGMIFGEVKFYFYIILFVLCSIIFSIMIKRERHKVFPEIFFDNKVNSENSGKKFLVFFLGCACLFFAIRGRIAFKSPIRIGTAYFCTYSFPNQAGLNPVYTLLSSFWHDRKPENRSLNLMDNQTAICNLKQFLNSGRENFEFPVARRITCDGPVKNYNVVIVIMEGMATFKMGDYGGPKNLTPNLNRLAEHGYSFKNIYTSGIHTFNGIYSTLFSFPALLKQQPLQSWLGVKHTGIANTLRKYNYQTVFFTNHDDQFDNVGGFLRANGFEKIVSQKDYPSNEVLGPLGVPDHFMFEYSVPVFSKMYENKKPFLGVFMTSSDHEPITIPDGIDFHPTSSEMENKIVEYADWSIGKFIDLASKETWFNNTVFVFISDHGNSMGHTYDMPLSFHHTPLIIYAPGIFSDTKSFEQLGLQIDLYPTLMGMLNISYVNNTMGIDLFKVHRPFAYFTADDKIGCLDHEFYWIKRNDGPETLYRYKDLSVINYLDSFKTRADSMRNYTYSMLQATQWIISNDRGGEVIGH